MEGIREEKIMEGLPFPASRRMKTEAALESVLAWIPAIENRFLLACAVKLLLFAFGSLERSSGFVPGQSSDAGEKLLFFREISAKYQKILPYLLSLNLPFCGSLTKNRLVRYEEYLEDMTEAWEFYQDPETDAKLRRLPRTMDKAARTLPVWRESMDFLK